MLSKLCEPCLFTHISVLLFPFRYRKGFELQPTLYSGINLAVLLIVAGQQFESSIELRKIGKRILNLPAVLIYFEANAQAPQKIVMRLFVTVMAHTAMCKFHFCCTLLANWGIL